MRLLSFLLCAVASLAGVGRGAAAAGPPQQSGADAERLPLRVTASRPGAEVVVDRGERSGLRRGDAVLLRPLGGGTIRGTVVEVEARSARVRLTWAQGGQRVGRVSSDLRLEPGTRGEVLIPHDRNRVPERSEPLPKPPLAPPNELGGGAEAAPQSAEESDESAPAGDPEHPAWQREDDRWQLNMPLLTGVEGVHPYERALGVSGRFYIIADQTWTTEEGRSDAFYRAGTDMLLENPFGRGGNLTFDGELTYRRADLPDQVDESTSDFRLDRLSYYWGGTRFDDERWEVGRFLQSGMPEFGVLDGVEYGRRFDRGDRFGGSVGYLPEPDQGMQSGEDLQFAGYYQMVRGENEELRLTAGAQKTFHNGDRDRDLIITKADYQPLVGWNFHATTWIDYYEADDDPKDTGFELTQAIVSTGKRYENGSGLDLTYTHLRFPLLERREFPPVLANQIEDDHRDRLALSGWRWVEDDRRLHTQLGAWIDEDEEGGDAELGLEVHDLWMERGEGDVTLYGALAAFSTVTGVRLSYGRLSAGGRWDGFYEVQYSFVDNHDDFLQNRIGVSRSFHTLSGWDISWHGEARVYDEEGGFSTGLFLQKSF